MNNEDTQSPEDIANILKAAFEPPTEGNQSFHHEVDLNAVGVDLTDNSEEDSLIREDAQKDGVVVPDLPEVKPTKAQSDFEDNPVQDVKDAVQSAFHADFDFATIDVDVVERDRYYRSGLHNEEMWYRVEPPGSGMIFKIAIPSVSRAEAVVSALDAWVKDKFIGTNSVQYMHGFQLLNAWLMVREINGVPTDWYEKAVEDAGGKLTYRSLRALLSDPDAVEDVREQHEARWSAITLACRIADHKHVLCLDAVRSRRVFTTAGSA